MSKNYTAKEILAAALRIALVEVFGESLECLDTDRAVEMQERVRGAIKAGFLMVTDEGVFALTAKGEAFMAA